MRGRLGLVCLLAGAVSLGYSGVVPKSADKVSFEPKPLKIGDGWHIVVTYASGMQEHIPGFNNEAEAREWLTGIGCRVWLRARGYEK